MSDQTYAELALGGIFPDHADRMHILVRTVLVEHLPVELQQTYQLLVAYFTLTAGIPKPREWRALLQRNGVEPAVRETLEGIYRKLYSLPNQEEHSWRFALSAMKTDRQTELMVDSLTDTMRVITEGVTGKDGERLYGYKAAFTQLIQKLGEIDQLGATAEATPEGDVMAEGDQIWEDYEARKTKDFHLGVQTGITTLDDLTFGAQRGEFWLIAAYAGHGKSQTLTNIAYQAVVSGHNVVYLTLETLRDQVRRRFITRHSNNQKLGAPEGLRYDDIKSGNLDAAGEAHLRKTIDDLKAEEYGRFEVVWMPRGSNIHQMKMKLDILESMFPVDLVVVDYAGLMGPGKRVERRQEGLVEILQGLKGLATGHGRGRGVPVLSAYQTSRQKLEEARASGGYTLDALAETAEAERSADLVMTLLRQHDEDSELRAQILKYRDGQTLEFYMEADFARSLVRDRSAGVRQEGSGFTGLFE